VLRCCSVALTLLVVHCRYSLSTAVARDAAEHGARLCPGDVRVPDDGAVSRRSWLLR
jgi:hypothetical protein